jgi:hypothetical protein
MWSLRAFVNDMGGDMEHDENAVLEALKQVQEAFACEAEHIGLKDEDDVVAMVKEIRRERGKSNSAQRWVATYWQQKIWKRCITGRNL